VETLADPRSFVRGVAYHRDGRVEISKRTESTIVAIVRGSMPYEVKLRSAGKPGWSCTCPVGEDGTFCKHCVAVALEVAEPEPAAKRPERRRSSKEPDLRQYVAGLDVEVLVELVLEQVESDWRLRERLQAAAVAAGGGSLDVRVWKSRIDAVFGGRDFVSYAEAGGWAHDVFDVLAALDDLVGTGHAAVVVQLAEHAHRRAEGAVRTSMTATGGSPTSPAGSPTSTSKRAEQPGPTRSSWLAGWPTWNSPASSTRSIGRR
jgi:SWIM zinc finger